MQILPQGYAGAANAVRFRYSLTAPDGNTWLLTASGALAPYTPYGGWQAGAPGAMSFVLGLTGTYLFTLECGDASNTVTRDTYPFTNAAFAPRAAFDLSTLVSAISGLCFDSLQRLWIWTGSSLVPLRLHYDAYLFDPDTQALYLTDAYDNVYMQ